MTGKKIYFYALIAAILLGITGIIYLTANLDQQEREPGGTLVYRESEEAA